MVNAPRLAIKEIADITAHSRVNNFLQGGEIRRVFPRSSVRIPEEGIWFRPSSVKSLKFSFVKEYLFIWIFLDQSTITTPDGQTSLNKVTTWPFAF